MRSAAFIGGVLLLSLSVSAHATLTVTSPPAGSTIVAAGDDYATQVLGNTWDMSDTADVDFDDSVGYSSLAMSGGLLNGTVAATGCAAGFFPLFYGYTTTVKTFPGELHPIDTSHYRFLTMKIRVSGGTAQQPNIPLYFANSDYATSTMYGAGTPKYLSPNVWTIQTWDLNTESSSKPWNQIPAVQGLEINTCSQGSPTVQVDWIRLTAVPEARQTYTVQWTDTGSATTYTVTAIDGDSARYQLGTGVTATSFTSDFSRLQPGDYTIEVKRADNALATSAGKIHINTPPQFAITTPSIRGEQSQSYAQTVLGNPWGPMDSADFKTIVNFKTQSFTTPAGSFYGRPSNNDPEFIMKTSPTVPINASFYRSACFTQEVFGPRSIGSGSIARFFWGPSQAQVTVSTDIILGSGLQEYCIPDLANADKVPVVSGGPWTGNLSYFRLDPDEFSPPANCSTPETCHDVRLDSIVLAPFAHASPAYVVHWTVADADYTQGGSITLYLDADETPDNGNEVAIGIVPYTAGSFTVIADGTVPDGEYFLFLRADDDVNAVAHYAGGKIVLQSGDEIFHSDFELQ